MSWDSCEGLWPNRVSLAFRKQNRVRRDTKNSVRRLFLALILTVAAIHPPNLMADPINSAECGNYCEGNCDGICEDKGGCAEYIYTWIGELQYCGCSGEVCEEL